MKKNDDMQKPNYQQGFSLIELIFTLVIFGVFTSISIVLLSKNLENERIKALTRQAVAWLENTKKIAIQKDSPCEIKVDNSSHELLLPSQSSAPLNKCIDLDTEPLPAAPLNLKETVENVDALILCSKELTTSESPTDPLSTLMASQCNANSSRTIFTPRGTLTDSVLITLSLSTQSEQRCIILQSPNSMIRSGKAKGGRCDFTTAY